jgi:hypothetical protein
MKRMLIALAIALIPLTVTPALAETDTRPSKAQLSAAELPRICFVFGPWKYCI